MLRIAMVSPYSVSVPGGVQAQVLGLSRELRRLGHEVRVLAPCDGPPPEPFVTPLGNSLPTAANGSVAPLAPDPSAALRTIRALNDEAFDIIHLHEPIVPGPTVTALLLKLAPTVGTFHAAGDSTSYRVLNKTARWAAEHLTTRVAVSDSAKELAHRYLGGEYTTLFNGIELQRYQKPHVDREASPTIFFCGRYEPRKGLEVLLQAMSHIPADVKLWIASDGLGIDDLQNTYGADSRIKWLGRISEEDKLDRLARCSVFCAPSLRGESFGIVLLEAMAAGAPLVASNISGYNNVTSSERNALLVEPGNPVELARCIMRTFKEPELRKSLVTGGYERATDFSMERLAEQYLSIYRKLLSDEKLRILEIKPNRFVAIFGDRILRRPKFLSAKDD
ncbi:MAG: glycosyltransferase family 4 protein [Actinobacteria bacterium]|mgnify:CR=1 FL=1|jgi:phosphatidyl-myo-inositol alpha-mannosyltransferase|nr:glycosyltransferase family 4 protein [Actinomycetota bacterium]MDA2951406.1 glycosyltransferase family 4 protein [Actinomycetota bacterium]MDA2998750.1 glycosyltransferase family 4 protein [Actinomycetota bacterium]